MTNLTEALKALLIEKGFNFTAIEKQVGIQRSTLNRFVRGEQSLRLDIADRLAAFLSVEIAIPDSNLKPIMENAAMSKIPTNVLLEKLQAQFKHLDPSGQETVLGRRFLRYFQVCIGKKCQILSCADGALSWLEIAWVIDGGDIEEQAADLRRQLAAEIACGLIKERSGKTTGNNRIFFVSMPLPSDVDDSFLKAVAQIALWLRDRVKSEALSI